MEYSLGTPKELDDITMSDVLKHNLWIWVWEAGLEDSFDESMQLPVIGLENITDEFMDPVITLKIADSDVIASATYNAVEDKLEAISIWEDNQWKTLRESSFEENTTFISTIKIHGVENRTFFNDTKYFDEAR